MSQIGRAEPLHLRLFIEGVEVPVISAVVSANEGAPASAQIEVVPANSGLHLVARSKVNLFFYDGGDGIAIPDADIAANAKGTRMPSDERSLLGSGYYQLFSGELFSLTYSKSGAGARSLVLQCLDDSNNWDTSFLYTLRYSADAEEGAVAGSTMNMMGISAPTSDDIITDPASIISTISKRQQALNPSVAGSKGMLGGLLGILELIGGVAGQYAGMTAWHTIQEVRVRLMDQIAADDGNTAVEVFNETAFDHWLLAGVSDLGTVVSFRTVVDLINQFIYYTVSPNPVGVYVPGDGGVPKWPDGLFDKAESVSKDSETGVDAGLDPDFATLKNAILAYLINDLGWNGAVGGKPKARMSSGFRNSAEQAALTQGTEREGQTPSSAHMVGFAADFSTAAGIGFCYKNKPSDSKGASLHRRLIWAATKYGLSDAQSIYTKGVEKGLLTLEEVGRAKQMVDFYRDLQKAVRERGQGKVTWGGDWDSSDAWLSLYGLGGDCVHTEMTGWRNKVKNKEGSTTSPADLSGYYSGLMNRERLFTQFFHPDIWFASPPACNVIFPEEVTTLSFSRDFMRETTRLQLSTVNAIVGDSTLLNQNFFAPKVDAALNLTSGGLGTAARAFILPHEKFSGIVPKLEKLSDLSLYVRLSEEQHHEEAHADVAETTKAAAEPSAEKKETELEVWADRTAAFTFLSHRYDARSLSVSMKFTPRLAVGFPALVIDRTNPETTEDEQAAPSTSAFSPNHFLGTIRALTHSVTQDGGATSVQLSHVRLHKASMDDLFASGTYANKGIMSVQVVPAPASPRTIKNTDTMTTQTLKWIVGVHEAMSRYKLDIAKPDMAGPAGRPLQGAITIVKVLPEGSLVTWSTNDGGPGSFAGPRIEESLPFSSITFTEPDGDPAYLPLEEAIKPAWMSETYSNKLIGGFYRQILGCGSIHDLYPNVPPGKAPDGTPYASTSVERVTEALVAEYTSQSDGGYLGHTFIHGKTRRSYASIAQVFGYWTGTGEARKHVQGFYTQSIGWDEGYSRLAKDRWEWMANAAGTLVNTTEPNQIRPELDPRRGRYGPALAYRDELARALGRRG
jgi:hypothetical protein